MTWQKGRNRYGVDDYYITNAEHTICKVTVRGNLSYELWHKDKFINRFNSSFEAKKAFENL